MSTARNLSPAEKSAYELIIAHDSLHQSELWKALDTNSRKGSRLATALEEKGLIEREQATNNGQRTYLLKPTNSQTSSATETGSGITERPPDDENDEELGTREAQGLALVQARGRIHQSDFWKELDVNSRTGSRIASNLKDNGLIRREEATYNGQRTYLLLPTKEDLDFSLLMAGDLISPLIGGEGDVDPIDSTAFNQWILKLADENR